MREITSLSGYQVTLLPVESQHLEQLRGWRNSDHVRHCMLNTHIITQTEQESWFASLAQKHDQQHYVIQYRGGLIGSCNIKTFAGAADKQGNVTLTNANQFELGLYIGDPRYLGNIIAFSPTLLMNDFCFEVLGALTLHAVVKSNNVAALRYNQKLGYEVISKGDVIQLVLTKDNYERESRILKNLLNR